MCSFASIYLRVYVFGGDAWAVEKLGEVGVGETGDQTNVYIFSLSLENYKWT